MSESTTLHENTFSEKSDSIPNSQEYRERKKIIPQLHCKGCFIR